MEFCGILESKCITFCVNIMWSLVLYVSIVLGGEISPAREYYPCDNPDEPAPLGVWLVNSGMPVLSLYVIFFFLSWAA